MSLRHPTGNGTPRPELIDMSGPHEDAAVKTAKTLGVIGAAVLAIAGAVWGVAEIAAAKASKAEVKELRDRQHAVEVQHAEDRGDMKAVRRELKEMRQDVKSIADKVGARPHP